MSADTATLEALVRAHAREAGERLGEAFVEQLRSNMPYRSGDMQRSVEVESVEEGDSNVVVRVVVHSEYAVYQNYGTGIYGPDGVPIYPRTPGGVLVFDWPAAGGVVFLRHVAGTEPQHFWERTLDQWPQIVAEAA